MPTSLILTSLIALIESNIESNVNSYLFVLPLNIAAYQNLLFEISSS